MVTKTEQARAAYLRGDIKTALRIAKGFRRGLTREEAGAITRAYECLVNPRFYQSIGRSPEAEIERGLQVFREKIM